MVFKKDVKNSVGRHIAFVKAVDIIQNASIKEKTKERLVYLLRKTSDSSLDKAIVKTREKFKLTSSQVNRLIYTLNKLDISPITLRNDSKDELLNNLLEFSRNI